MYDNNRPDGLWGEVYDKETGALRKSNRMDRPVVALWKGKEVTELLKEIQSHYVKP